jgi:hypothetical protein
LLIFQLFTNIIKFIFWHVDLNLPFKNSSQVFGAEDIFYTYAEVFSGVGLVPRDAKQQVEVWRAAWWDGKGSEAQS